MITTSIIAEDIIMKFDRINVNRLDDIGYVIDKEKFLKFVNDYRRFRNIFRT